MGTVFRKRSTRALPAGATITTKGGRRVARWTAKGKAKTAEYVEGNDGAGRIVTESRTYFAKYRDGGGIVRVVATGCRDEASARQRLAELERTAERVKIGIATEAEADASDRRADAFGFHLDDYLTYLEARGTSPAHRAERKRQLTTLADALPWRVMGDLKADPLADWLVKQLRESMGARTRNTYLAAALAFANWAKEHHRIAANPFTRIPKADASGDLRRQRRALTDAELQRLLDVAARRPLDDARTVRRGERRGQTIADVRPDVVERLLRVGRERALIYKTLVLTGLRRGELASLTIGQLYLDEDLPYAELAAGDSKNREAATLPLRADLAADLRAWLALRLDEAREEAREAGLPVPMRPDASLTLFNVPGKLCKILARDLKAAGIAKRDDRGRVVDVHALRHSFGTMLSRAGVAPRTAQAAMRHAKIDLTMNVYTDPRLLDVAGALDTLPALALTPADDRQRATGTAGRTVAPTVAPTRRRTVQNGSSPVILAGSAKLVEMLNDVDVTSCTDKRKEPLTTPVSGPRGVGVIGLEPMTPSLSSGGQTVAGPTNHGISDTPANGCTNGCTGEPPTGTVEALAAALFALSDADRQRLAALLAGQAKGEDAR